MLAVSGVMMAGPGDASAQDYRNAASWNAGGIFFSSMNPDAGLFEGQSAHELKLDPGWLVGVQFEHWFGSGRVGARVNGALTQRPLDLPGVNRSIGVWMADADLMLRLLPARAGHTIVPYLGVGGGLVRYKLGRGEFLNFATANALYDGDDDPRLAGNAFVGFDILTGLRWDGDSPVGFRIEVADHVTLDSPFEEAGGDRFPSIHNVRIVLGVFSGFGLLR
jgi:hypothetical protein